MNLNSPKEIGEFKQRIYFFTLKLIELIDSLPKDDVSKKINDQLFQSGTSVISKFIEATASATKKDLSNSTIQAIKFANEAKLWLALIRDSKRAKAEKVKWFLEELDEISQILAASIKS
ncbi:MAG: four helix bundle protein [Stygiobacter sp.]|jgi:four helix bundle protein|uniref:Four helix bundle protein n=1 Tax=Stygiobacter electus TaxID=3032292 RepID=A0AAE3P217_9BACT|nr:four helix bundle protein [Stygiobacter electus]MDF1612957.1 four helix bundle protein [Stygiobacter electus]